MQLLMCNFFKWFFSPELILSVLKDESASPPVKDGEEDAFNTTDVLEIGHGTSSSTDLAEDALNDIGGSLA